MVACKGNTCHVAHFFINIFRTSSYFVLVQICLFNQTVCLLVFHLFLSVSNLPCLFSVKLQAVYTAKTCQRCIVYNLRPKRHCFRVEGACVCAYTEIVYSIFSCLCLTATWAAGWEPAEQAEQPESHLPYLQGRPLDHKVSVQGHSRWCSGHQGPWNTDR